jgi:putative DNA primase/helicase
MSADVHGCYAALGVELPVAAVANAQVPCPFNADAHRHGDRSASCSISLDSGVFCCHGCGARGGAYDAAIMLGRPPREAMRLLRSHGLAGDTPIAVGASETGNGRAGGDARRSGERHFAATEVEVERHRAALGKRSDVIARLDELRHWTPEAITALELGLDRDRVTLPVRTGAGQLVGLLRYAPDPGSRNGAPKMLAEPGSARELFPAPETISSPELFVVEGEPDAVTGAALGLPTVALPGAAKWRPEWAARVALGRERVVVIPDADEPGRRAAARVAAAIAEHCADVRILDLHPDRTDGSDLGDFTADVGDDGDRKVAAAALMRAVEDAPHAPAAQTSGANVAVCEIAEGETLASSANGPGREREQIELLPPPSAPMEVARAFAAARFAHPTGSPVLRHWRGSWWRWQTSRWAEVEQHAMRKEAYVFTEHARYQAGDDTKPWAPNHRKVADLLEALAAVCHLSETVGQPEWVDAPDAPHGVVVASANGLLNVTGRTLLGHDPRFFNHTAVPFDFDAGAPAPERWLQFLDELWPDDRDSIAALQEWFGYVISCRLDLHKILLLVGPTRAGKGVIAGVLRALVGPRNVAAPALSSLGTEFGLAPLLGKPLAIVGDARFDPRDSRAVVERLLSVSGEDAITVNRKFKDQWTGKLPSRFVVISNELPRLGDASAAIANRFVVLLLSRSWLGNEDHELARALERELPGTLNWALDGLDRLAAKDRFTPTSSSSEAIIALQDLASPVGAFVRDRCVVGEHQVAVDELYAAWRHWCDENGHHPTSKQTFGRDLRAAVPGLKDVRTRAGDDRHREYRGIGLREHNGRSRHE